MAPCLRGRLLRACLRVRSADAGRAGGVGVAAAWRLLLRLFTELVMGLRRSSCCGGLFQLVVRVVEAVAVGLGGCCSQIVVVAADETFEDLLALVDR